MKLSKASLRFLDSVPTTASIIMLVFASLIVAGSQGNDGDGLGYEIFEYFVFATFASELVIRFYCVCTISEVWRL